MKLNRNLMDHGRKLRAEQKRQTAWPKRFRFDWLIHGFGKVRPNSSKPEPAMSDIPSIPHIPLDEIAQSFNELHSKLLSGDLPARPFWLQIGNSGYQITDTNRDTLALGLLLCLDVRGHLGR